MLPGNCKTKTSEIWVDEETPIVVWHGACGEYLLSLWGALAHPCQQAQVKHLYGMRGRRYVLNSE